MVSVDEHSGKVLAGEHTTRVHETKRHAPGSVQIEFGGKIQEIEEIRFISGAASTGSMITRISKAIISAKEPVWIWTDTDELSWTGEPVILTNVIENVFRARSKAGRETHFRSVTRSIIGAMHQIIESATLQARAIVGVHGSAIVPMESIGEYEAERVERVEEAIRDNAGTEELLFGWRNMIADGAYIGSIEIRAIANQVGNDYVIIGIGEDSKVLSEWVIIRNERCRGTGPFEGVGLSVNPWTLAGSEIERKMAERWHEAIENPPRIHSANFARFAIALWDQGREQQEQQKNIDRPIAPGIMAAINMVETDDSPHGDIWSFDSGS